MSARKDLAELPTEHLEAELCELASHLAAGMARWIALVDEYGEGWGSWWGVNSTAHWTPGAVRARRGWRASTSASRGRFATCR